MANKTPSRNPNLFKFVHQLMNLSLTDFVNVFINAGLMFKRGGNSTNTGLGDQAMSSVTSTADGNTALGRQTLTSLTTGLNNTAVGNSSQYYMVSGQRNTSVGSGSLQQNVSGQHNTVIGAYASQTALGSFNTVVGSAAGAGLTDGTYNLFLGYYTGRAITTGNYNTVVGSNYGGLTAATSNNIVLCDGQGNAKYQFDGTLTQITGGMSVNSTDNGFFVPRMTLAQRTAISSPGTGMLVYQTDGTEGLYVKKASAWAIFTAT